MVLNNHFHARAGSNKVRLIHKHNPDIFVSAVNKALMVGGSFASWYGIAVAEIDAEICDYCYIAYTRSLL